jgi:hypothetical protein
MGLLIDNLSKLYLPYRMRLDEEEAEAKERERLAKRARMAKNKSTPDATLPIKRAKRHQPSPVAATPAAQSTKKAAKKDGLPAEEEEEESEEVDDDDVMDINTFDTQKLVMGEDDKKYLESLSELKRETILAERFDKLKNDADMKNAIREMERKAKSAKMTVSENRQNQTVRSTRSQRPIYYEDTINTCESNSSMLIECPTSCHGSNGVPCLNNVMQTFNYNYTTTEHPLIRVTRMGKKGDGVVAREQIAAGTFIAEYIGR